MAQGHGEGSVVGRFSTYLWARVLFLKDTSRAEQKGREKESAVLEVEYFVV